METSSPFRGSSHRAQALSIFHTLPHPRNRAAGHGIRASSSAAGLLALTNRGLTTCSRRLNPGVAFTETMRTEADKAPDDLAVFVAFVQRAALPVVPGSAEKRHPPEPDILCRFQSGEVVAFELTEACAPEFAAAESKALKEGIAFAWGNDVSEKTISKKLRQTYRVSAPVELLLYTNGRTALPDEAIKAKIEPLLSGGLGQFRRVWFMGDEVSAFT